MDEDPTALLGKLRRLAARDDSEMARAFRDLDERMQRGMIPYGWQAITQDEYAHLRKLAEARARRGDEEGT